jgi:hypothetical protein
MAIALSKEKVQAQHGLMMILTLITLFIVNNLVLHVANMIFPDQIVLGSASVSHWWAMYHSMFKLSVICTMVMPLVTMYEWKNKVVFTPKQWMVTYFVINFGALWIISRFAENFGLGFSSWFVILLFAGVLDMVQGMAMMALGEQSKKFLK